MWCVCLGYADSQDWHSCVIQEWRMGWAVERRLLFYMSSREKATDGQIAFVSFLPLCVVPSSLESVVIVNLLFTFCSGWWKHGVKKKYECLELNCNLFPIVIYISKSVLHFKPFCYVKGINMRISKKYFLHFNHCRTVEQIWFMKKLDIQLSQQQPL